MRHRAAHRAPTLRRLISLTPLLALLVLAAGCSGDGGAAGDSSASVGSTPGAHAPDFELELVGGGKLRLADLRGRAVIVDFWDTWCPPCRKALPHLQELHDEYADRLTVVGIAFGRDGRDAVSAFLAKNNLSFPCVFIDDDYATARAYGGVQGLPTTFLIDPDGVIRKVWVGGYGKQVYEAALREIFEA